MPMPEAAVVALHSETETIATEDLTVEADLSGESGAGKRRGHISSVQIDRSGDARRDSGRTPESQ
jgi:hypothetical protein